MSNGRLILALGLIVAAARADVIVIDPAGGPGATALMQALAAAAPGDVLLLEPGDYEQDFLVYLIDKGITLLPASPGARITLGPVQVEYVPAGQSVVLRGFDIHAFVGGGAPLVISQLRGTTWIEDCSVAGSAGQPSTSPFFAQPGGEAAVVFQAHAIFRHCSFTGGAGGDAAPGAEATWGGDALRVVALSQAALYDCTLVGGASGNGPS